MLINTNSKTFPTKYKRNDTDYAKGWNACIDSVMQQKSVDIVNNRPIGKQTGLDKIDYAKVLCEIINEKKGMFSKETIKDFLMVKHSLVCIFSKIGVYDCCTDILICDDGSKISVDVCMMNEIRTLKNKYKIKTIGCCCGHQIKTPYIQVSNESVERMLELGYELLPTDTQGNGSYCFRPKTNL